MGLQEDVVDVLALCFATSPDDDMGAETSEVSETSEVWVVDRTPGFTANWPPPRQAGS